MNQQSVLQIASQALMISLKLSAPILVVTLGIGLFVSMIQSATQIQEQSLTFVPKLAGVGLVILIAGNWMLGELMGYTRELYNLIPQLVS
ncbi:MAG: flagellar biosynthetic protein FliQ [Acidimicrobiia bacterium]